MRLVSDNAHPTKPKPIWLATREGVQREFPTKKLAEAYASGR